MELENKNGSGLRQNKLPGSEKFTRPEELECLHKYLGSIREVQDEHTKLTDWELGIYGRNTGSIPDIDSLDDTVDKLDGEFKDNRLSSESIQLKDETNVSLNNTVEKLKIEEHLKLGDSSEKLNVQDIDSLDNSSEKLNVQDINSLDNSSEKLNVQDINSLDNSSEKLNVQNIDSLDNSSEKLNVQDIESLSKDIVKSYIDEKVSKLDSTKEELSFIEDVNNLESSSEKLIVKDDSKLDTTIETIVDEREDILDTTVETIVDEREDVLDTTVEKLNSKESVNSLSDFIEELNQESDIDNLSNHLEKVSSQNNQRWDNNLDNTIINNKENNRWSEKLDNTKSSRSSAESFGAKNNLQESGKSNWSQELSNSQIIRPEIVTTNNSIKDQDPSKDNWKKDIGWGTGRYGLSKNYKRPESQSSNDSIDNLEDTLINRSEGELGRDIKNNSQDSDKSNWSYELQNNIEKRGGKDNEPENLVDYEIASPYDRGGNDRKKLLNNSIESQEIDDNELFNTVMSLIDSQITENGEHGGYKTGATTEWYKKLEALMSTYLSGNASANSILKFEDRLSDLSNIRVDLNKDSIVEHDHDVEETYALDGEYSEGIPKYSIVDPGADVITKISSYLSSSATGILREQAERLLSKSGLRGKLKAKALTEALIVLSKTQRATEVFLQKNLDRLPGSRSSKKLLSSVWNYASSAATIAKNISDAKGSHDINAYTDSILTGANVVSNLWSAKSNSVKNRPAVKTSSKVTEFFSKNERTPEPTTEFELANSRPKFISADRLDSLLNNSCIVWDIPGIEFDGDFNVNSPYKNGRLNFKDEYLNSEGIQTTIFDLCTQDTKKHRNSDGTTSVIDSNFNMPSSFEDLKELIKESPYITTVGKFGQTSQEGGQNSMTLSDNGYWEIRIEPFCNYEMNGGWSYLPAFQEINLINQRLHGVHTGYNEWVPVVSFDYEKSKLNTKSAGLYEGEIVYPITAEMTNELRLTVVDDMYKSWSGYFRKCMEVSVYNSVPHNINYYKGYRYDKRFNVNEAIEPWTPTFVDRLNPCTALYKNITFRIRLFVMTPQYSTIRSFDLLCVLKDFQENYMGTVDAGGSSDLDLQFSIVGENPDAYVPPVELYEGSLENQEMITELYKDSTEVGNGDKGALTLAQSLGDRLKINTTEASRNQCVWENNDSSSDIKAPTMKVITSDTSYNSTNGNASGYNYKADKEFYGNNSKYKALSEEDLKSIEDNAL